MNDDMQTIIDRANHLLSFFHEWCDSMSPSEWQWIADKCWRIAHEDFRTGKLQVK